MSFGNAFGAFVPRRGGGGPGPSTPEFAPKYVVGNAPNGDTPANCDFLDPGDGSGIAAALLAAAAIIGDVWIRPGIYDFSPGNLNPLIIPAGVRVWGAGGGTVLIAPTQNEINLFRLTLAASNNAADTATELAWLRIIIDGHAGGSTSLGLVIVTGLYGFGSSLHHLDISTRNPVSFLSPYRLVEVNNNLDGFLIDTSSFLVEANTSGGSPDTGVVCVYGVSSGATPALRCRVETCSFSGGDFHIALQGHTVQIADTTHRLFDVRNGAAVLISPLGETNTIGNATVTIDSNTRDCVGVRCASAPAGFGQPAGVNGTAVRDCSFVNRNRPGFNNTAIEVIGPAGLYGPNNNLLIAGNQAADFDIAVSLVNTDNCLVLGNVFRNCALNVLDSLAPTSSNEIAHNIFV